MQPVKTDNYLSSTIELARNIQCAFWKLAERLVKIKGDSLWAGTFASYEDFLEEIQVSKSMDSKLRTVYLRFHGELKEAELTKVGISKLYLIASRCTDAPQTQDLLRHATEMTRADLADEIREKTHGEHICKGDEVRFLICNTCGKWNKIVSP